MPAFAGMTEEPTERRGGVVKPFAALALAAGLALLAGGCDDAPGEWAAIVYPDRADRTRFDVTPRFKTLSYCRDNAIERMKAIQVKTGGDYECGFRCQLDGDPHRKNICEEKRK